MNFKEIISRIFCRRKKSLGTIAEDRAAEFLKKRAHMKIAARNWRYGRYETDIIAYDKISDSVVFAEVKCRPQYAKVSGYLAATSKHKAACLKKCAAAYVAKHRLQNMNRRFDVVEVVHNGDGEILEILHFENVRL